MPYVIKAMCYMDEENNGKPNLSHANRYETKELAELAAYVCGGEVVEVITPSNNQNKTIKKKINKANQAWMRKERD